MQTNRRWSYCAAAVLALVTLSVFRVLRYYGPESAVRRFISVGMRIDSELGPGQGADLSVLSNQFRRELADVSLDAPTGPYNQYLINFAVRPMAALGRYEIARIDYQQPDQVTVAVVFLRPNGSPKQSTPDARVWIVDLSQDGIWRINAKQTVQVTQEMLGRATLIR